MVKDHYIGLMGFHSSSDLFGFPRSNKVFWMRGAPGRG